MPSPQLWHSRMNRIWSFLRSMISFNRSFNRIRSTGEILHKNTESWRRQPKSWHVLATRRRRLGCRISYETMWVSGMERSANGESLVFGNVSTHERRKQAGLNFEHPAAGHFVSEDRVRNFNGLPLFIRLKKTFSSGVGQ